MLQSNLTKNHYQTLCVDQRAPHTEIKIAYRKLAKKFHPDCNPSPGSHERITALNLAYEVLSNPQSRANYDRSLGINTQRSQSSAQAHSSAQAQTQSKPRRSRQTSQDEDLKFDHWFRQVYEPIIEMTAGILEDLDLQIEQLADDPFDDQLMEDFEDYLDQCRRSLQYAQTIFHNLPNPKSAAGVAEYIYYALNHLSDGMDELNYFTQNFDDRHLHTGREMWRLVDEMCYRAQSAMASILP